MPNPIDSSLRALFSEVIAERGAHGLDMAPVQDWPPATVLCVTGKHEVVPGQDCSHCSEPKCAGCPGKEED